jgi:hypothetical protein
MVAEESIGERYHQLNSEKPGQVCFLDEQSPAYFYALGRLYKEAGMTWKSDQKILFGGFYPDQDNNRASRALVELMSEKNSPEGQIDSSLSCILDISSLSVVKAKEGGKDAVQANLADLPFAPNSLDVVFLDYTVHFMSDETRDKMFGRLYDALSPQGLVFIATNGNLLSDFGRLGRYFDSLRSKWANKVDFWNNRPIEPHLGKYKKVFSALCDRTGEGNFDLTVVARQESPFKEYRDKFPIAIERDSEKFGDLFKEWGKRYRKIY